MNRREMLKAIAPMSLGFVFKLDTQNGELYHLYVNDKMIDVSKLPPMGPNVIIIPVPVEPGETLEDAVRMYEVIR